MHEILRCHRKAGRNALTMLLLENYNDDVEVMHTYNATISRKYEK
jgi:hypothetical protein